MEGEDAGCLLPHVEVSDSPALRYRGFMLDVSRNRVPTLGTLKELVDRLSALKFNALQLYTEHTFAYAGHEAVWAGAGAVTHDEVKELRAYAAAR